MTGLITGGAGAPLADAISSVWQAREARAFGAGILWLGASCI
ncbi:MAG: hypothetical protein QOE03_3129 [Micromonosporaceae bacterium]|nr:hypothetical protein [Micromonosporaceae bacterium]